MKRKVIALTGKIGSGKSAVSRILRNLGYETVDCDELAKQVAKKPEVVKRVEQLLGSECVVDGELNRKAIRETVFSDANLLKQYEQIFFDGVKALLTEKLATLKDAKAVFVEIPVLDAFFFNWDEIWRVESSEQACISRVVKRDNVSAENACATLNSQKVYSCTYVIENNGSMEQLEEAVHIILSKTFDIK
ncbi:MAG: dephospho-CoA kinase [Clostridiales bacterium]|nr:dephospho-CoA kinase [Clostridiales bacterium]